VGLKTILIGVLGIIYQCHIDLTLGKQGLDRCTVKALNTNSMDD